MIICEEENHFGFCHGPGKVDAAKLLSSLFIESIAKIKQDILVSPLNVKGQKLITKRLLDEIHRRHKIYIFKAMLALIQPSDWLAGKIDGIATEKPEIFLEYFKIVLACLGYEKTIFTTTVSFFFH